MRPNDRRPIGIFDSGVGGLTVLRALREALPAESTVYLGDTARVPYGTKSADVVTRYSVRNAEFLLQHDIKLLVVACNTASAVALPTLKARLGIPVVGVIDPGAQTAVRHSRTGRIGVIGTPGTIASGAYQAALRHAGQNVHVVAKACPLFVPLAEEGWLDGEVPLRIAERYLAPMAQDGIDTLVLGCTHYPLLRETIGYVMGPQVRLVDSAHATAEVVRSAVGLPTRKDWPPPRHQAFVTDVPERFLEVGARFLGHPLAGAEQVDISFN